MSEKTLNLAAIDIGSNAARLLIKSLSEEKNGIHFSKLLFLRIPLRLGMDVFSSGKISDETKSHFVHTMQAFAHLMKAYNVQCYKACATSAMREAKNNREVLELARQKSKLKLELISGEEESRIIYENHLNLLQLKGHFLFVDVGGGSTEIALMMDGIKIANASYNVGAIRLLKENADGEELKKMEKELREITQECSNLTIIGSGGNIGKIYRIVSKSRKDDDVIPIETLEKFYQKIRKMEIEERMRLYDLKSDRADVIEPAAKIFLRIAKCSGAKQILVPNLGLTDGLISELGRQYFRKGGDLF